MVFTHKFEVSYRINDNCKLNYGVLYEWTCVVLSESKTFSFITEP